MSNGNGNEAIESRFPKLQTFSESVEPLLINRDPNPTQNEHVYVICYSLEVAGDAISGENVKTIEGYAVLKFEVASLSSFLDIPKQSFRDGGGGHRR